MNKAFKIILLGIVILSSIYSTSAENLIYSSTDDLIDKGINTNEVKYEK